MVIKFVFRTHILKWTKPTQLTNRIPMEIAILKEIRKHSCIHLPDMKLYFDDEHHYFILMEYEPAVDLFEYIEEHSKIPDGMIKLIFKQILLAVDCLHSLGIVHRDIKVNQLIGREYHNYQQQSC